MKTGVFRLPAQIIELTRKPKAPVGELAENPSGDIVTFQMKYMGTLGLMNSDCIEKSTW